VPSRASLASPYSECGVDTGSFGDRADLQRLLLTEEALVIKANETPAGAKREIAFLSIQPLFLQPFLCLGVTERLKDR
jgi:hypothetical protein